MTFTPAVNPAPNDPKGEQSYPFLAMSPDDKVYISYLNLDYDKPTDMSGTPTVLRVVSSQDGGKTFSNRTMLIILHVSVVLRLLNLDPKMTFTLHHDYIPKQFNCLN